MAQSYMVIQVASNGKETILSTLPIILSTATELLVQQTRDQAIQNARNRKASNPANRYVVTGPTETNTARVVGDRIWDSAVDL